VWPARRAMRSSTGTQIVAGRGRGGAADLGGLLAHQHRKGIRGRHSRGRMTAHAPAPTKGGRSPAFDVRVPAMGSLVIIRLPIMGEFFSRRVGGPPRPSHMVLSTQRRARCASHGPRSHGSWSDDAAMLLDSLDQTIVATSMTTIRTRSRRWALMRGWSRPISWPRPVTKTNLRPDERPLRPPAGDHGRGGAFAAPRSVQRCRRPWSRLIAARILQGIGGGGLRSRCPRRDSRRSCRRARADATRLLSSVFKDPNAT